jgi:hypothetical protein
MLGRYKREDGRVGHGDPPQGTALQEAAEFCRQTIGLAEPAWEQM